MILTDCPELRNIPWRCVVIDEAHRLKNRNCKLLEGLKMMDLVSDHSDDSIEPEQNRYWLGVPTALNLTATCVGFAKPVKYGGISSWAFSYSKVAAVLDSYMIGRYLCAIVLQQAVAGIVSLSWISSIYFSLLLINTAISYAVGPGFGPVMVMKLYSRAHGFGTLDPVGLVNGSS